MCGRFSLAVESEMLQAAFPGFEIPAGLPVRRNIAPSQPVAAIANMGERRVEFFRWGLIPVWAKDPAIGDRMFNARAETLAEKPSFRDAFQRRRCLILADGFYEWRAEPGKRAKTPFYFTLASGMPFAFAGLWDVWQSPTGEPVSSCTLITTEPNALVLPIHNRMPVILPPEAYALWLDPAPQDPARLRVLLTAYPAELMRAEEISRVG